MTAMDCHREGVLDIPMLILKYDQYRTTENSVCLYLRLLISSSKIEVLLFLYVTRSCMHSHIYDQFLLHRKYVKFWKYDPVCSLVQSKVGQDGI